MRRRSVEVGVEDRAAVEGRRFAESGGVGGEAEEDLGDVRITGEGAVLAEEGAAAVYAEGEGCGKEEMESEEEEYNHAGGNVEYLEEEEMVLVGVTMIRDTLYI